MAGAPMQAASIAKTAVAPPLRPRGPEEGTDDDSVSHGARVQPIPLPLPLPPLQVRRWHWRAARAAQLPLRQLRRVDAGGLRAGVLHLHQHHRAEHRVRCAVVGPSILPPAPAPAASLVSTCHSVLPAPVIPVTTQLPRVMHARDQPPPPPPTTHTPHHTTRHKGGPSRTRPCSRRTTP